MAIACLGWGSLVWNPAGLPCGEWHENGPELPIEFCRVSRDGRVTLVIEGEAGRVPVLWSILDVASLAAAVTALADREEVPSEASIGRWPSTTRFPFKDEIGLWAAERNLDGVVWTALKPGFPNSRGVTPTLEELRTHLDGLDADQRMAASTYIMNAPAQIRTNFRQHLTELLAN